VGADASLFADLSHGAPKDKPVGVGLFRSRKQSSQDSA
jgi:hypothetical protein